MSEHGSALSESSFRRSYDSLPRIFDFIEGFFASRRIDPAHLPVICLAVEELFTNMVRHCPGVASEIVIGMGLDDRRLAVTLTDFDVDRFDINDRPDVRVDQPISERVRGGLGIHLVKKMVDRVEYEYADRKSRTTVIKNLE